MGFLDIFKLKDQKYKNLQEKYTELMRENEKLKASKKEFSDKFNLLEKEKDYYLDLIFNLRAELANYKNTIHDGSLEDKLKENMKMNLDTSSYPNEEPRYTNLGDKALRIDKFPGKIGYTPKK